MGGSLSKQLISKRYLSASNLCIAYAALMLAIFAVFRTYGDVTFLLKALAFGPRWILLLPIVLLVLQGVRRKLNVMAYLSLCVAIVCVVLGVMDYQFPASSKQHTADGSSIRVMTFNTNVGSKNANKIFEFVQEAKPDIVALQECNVREEIRMPSEYECYSYGELFFATKYPVISSPESRHSFRGKIEDVRAYTAALNPAEALRLYEIRKNELSDPWEDQRLPLQFDMQAGRGQHVVESESTPKDKPSQLTLALRFAIDQNQPNQERQFVLDHGDSWKGLNVYLYKEQIFVGVWRDKSAYFVELDCMQRNDICVVLSDARKTMDVFHNGAFAGSSRLPTMPDIRRDTVLGSFHQTTRGISDDVFPFRSVRFELDYDGYKIQVVNAHLPTPRAAFVTPLKHSARYKRFLADYRKVVQSMGLDANLPPIVAGDFNAPQESGVYEQHWMRFANAFEAVGSGYGFTKWTPVFFLGFGSRIDHLLYRYGISALNCRLGPPLDSDHLPLICDFKVETP